MSPSAALPMRQALEPPHKHALKRPASYAKLCEQSAPFYPKREAWAFFNLTLGDPARPEGLEKHAPTEGRCMKDLQMNWAGRFQLRTPRVPAHD